MQSAPLHHDVADTSGDGRAYWITTPDGIRLRFAFWSGEAGCAVVYPGRGEYIEKYGRVVRELQHRKLGCLIWDWRNQGLSDRPSTTGHIENYQQYQVDAEAVFAAAAPLVGQQRRHLIAHSMGGLIALRSLQSGAMFNSAVFSGPMWGMGMPPPLRITLRTLSEIATFFGAGKAKVIGTQRSSYIANADPSNNTLMADADTASWVQTQLQIHPELALGGPSWAWLRASHAEISSLTSFELPDLPTLTLVGEQETVVDANAIRSRVSSSTNGKLVICPDAKHEVLMEAGNAKKLVWNEIEALWARSQIIG